MKKYALFALMSACSFSALSQQYVVKMTDLNTGKNAGVIKASTIPYGTLFTPNLVGLPPGLHGFHIHENSSCAPSTMKDKKVAGGGAGGHYDPEKTGKHGFPWTTDNHLGDLPALYVDQKGNANHPVMAPRVKLSDLQGRAVMIHAGGDNYSDHPHQLGGGGARLFCGVVSKAKPMKSK